MSLPKLCSITRLMTYRRGFRATSPACRWRTEATPGWDNCPSLRQFQFLDHTGCSRCDRANGAVYQFGLRFRSAYRSSALELPYLHKTEKIRQNRFRTLVFIGSIRVEPIRTAARIRIDQCCLQIVFAKKPTERARRPCRPLRAIIRTPRGKARRNRC